MIERYNKNYETIEREGLKTEVINKLNRKTKANTFSGYLISAMKNARDEGNWELAKLLESMYEKYKEYHPKKLNTVEIKDGWKGKDRPEIYKTFENDFEIIMHQKDKDGEVKKIDKEITKENVNRLWQFIQDWEIGETRKCYDFAEVLGENSWREVWKKRTDVYFPLYYYPLKVLEALNLIKYGGSGKITRLK